LKSKIKTKHRKDFLCVKNNKTQFKIDNFVDFTQILLIKAVCLARLQAREFGVATCIL
jgi:hypothetical protein